MIVPHNISDILNKLQHAKTAGKNKWTADCPCANHSTPAKHLSIENTDDKALVKCFGAHTYEDVCLALGYDSLTYDKQVQPIRPKAEVVCAYDYLDEKGNPLFQVVRYDPKAFRQRHKNGAGEWVYNLEGVRRVLYHLPELLAVTNETVYLVEGEKDADNLIKWGQIATTSPQGASAWKPEYANFLKGKRVVIIPDKDTAGYNYARQAAESLQSKACELKTIILPNPAKDISDWLELDGDVSRLPDMEQSIECLTSLTSLTNGQMSDITDNLDRSDRPDQIDKVDGADKEIRGKIIWRAVDEWQTIHRGESFDLDTICRHLNIKNATSRHHVAKKLSYEVSQGNLEKSDRLYIYIDKTLSLVDWVNASDSETLKLKWPYGRGDQSEFGFDGKVVVSPGDIIVIAGDSNMGKTTFILNLLWENMDDYPCTLMGNEYVAGKFKRRVKRMDWRNPLKEDGTPKFELINRRSRWQDIIRPNNINLIDWISLGDKFYQVGVIIDGIQSRLRNGIAVIVLQKGTGKSLGLGGQFGEHLASLYLAIDYQRLTVVKAKEWHEFNPNNKIYGFTIVDGGTKFHNIREIKKCSKCYGTGHTKGGECDVCVGSGYVDAK